MKLSTKLIAILAHGMLLGFTLPSQSCASPLDPYFSDSRVTLVTYAQLEDEYVLADDQEVLLSALSLLNLRDSTSVNLVAPRHGPFQSISARYVGYIIGNRSVSASPVRADRYFYCRYGQPFSGYGSVFIDFETKEIVGGILIISSDQVALNTNMSLDDFGIEFSVTAQTELCLISRNGFSPEYD
ncbi:hypothetical protein [Ponticaulis koreensis]|uniref:hypothetical protein n=1 Tax=Ponticaulis koreensis TaxID=1123045 RepID=UPI0003B43889|nr:hypothetical protein [Ponticaulis koreensis]